LASFAAQRMTFRLVDGPGNPTASPGVGPYDVRLGYTSLFSTLRNLENNGFTVTAHAEVSPLQTRAARLGLPPIYREKSQAGLRIVDDRGGLVYDARTPRRVYSTYAEIPTVLVQSLLFAENREILDTSTPFRNPTVEWDRLGRAMFDFGIHFVDDDHPVTGGSTVATQLEKLRHSGGGRTASSGDKFRQMLAASLRSYQDGPRNLDARRQIVCDYINSLPLAATPSQGEVRGLGDGLSAWFDADVAQADRVLRLSDEAAENSGQMDLKALAYRQVLSLLLSAKRPSSYLGANRDALKRRVDSYLRLLADQGVISPALRDATLEMDAPFRDQAPQPPVPAFADRKSTDSIRAGLLPWMGVRNLYDLDRLDLTVHTTIDQAASDAATRTLRSLNEIQPAADAGLFGEHLLNAGSATGVVYSFTLYEHRDGANLLRVQSDNYGQPLNISQGTKLELGSTAKLRTLSYYLETVAELHARLSDKTPQELRSIPVDREDPLSSWATAYFQYATDKSLDTMLEAAMHRVYSASPSEGFFTGGGVHHFSNFESSDNARALTVREAFDRSVNLVFIRLMRDLVHYRTFQRPESRAVLDSDASSPLRRQYLSRFADFEGQEFLAQFYRKRLSLDLHGSLTRIHPLELWLMTYLAAHPHATFEQVIAASASERQQAYEWLFNPSQRRAQDLRIRIMLERDTFHEIHAAWARDGFPFGQLVPSLATAIGSSGDNPDALAVLAGIILNGGVKYPSVEVRRLHFAEATPMETILDREPAKGEQVMPPAVAALLQRELIGVVEHGTAQRAHRSIVLSDGQVIPVGGKTGTGDNRIDRFGPGGTLLESKVRNRTAAFVFTIGDRFFGTVLVYAPGPEAAKERFTSSLAVQVFKGLVPAIRPLLE
jgi:membrane peptidoglycan carboxypeptidase